jgi:four helix bundle protein
MPRDPLCQSIERDPLWTVESYRMSHAALGHAWADVRVIGRFRVLEPATGQLYRAIASIAANIAEGYSRGSGRDRARFYEYALGSARESIVWYHAARPVLPRELVEERIDRLTRIRRLLLTMIPDQRTSNRPATAPRR